MCRLEKEVYRHGNGEQGLVAKIIKLCSEMWVSPQARLHTWARLVTVVMVAVVPDCHAVTVITCCTIAARVPCRWRNTTRSVPAFR
jgi:hypothetical protein